MPGLARDLQGGGAAFRGSRDVGFDLPASIPAFPPSRNWRFQFPIACSDTFSRRAASAIETSP